MARTWFFNPSCMLMYPLSSNNSLPRCFTGCGVPVEARIIPEGVTPLLCSV
jgi:hypothetical protein